MSPEEKERLKQLGSDYPFFVSTSAIGENLEGKTVLDVGAGPNTALGAWVRSHGGRYIAFDTQESALAQHTAAGHETVQGDVRSLLSWVGSVDIIHARLLLMHLHRDHLEGAILEMVSAAKERCLFVEPNWITFQGNSAVIRLRDFAIGWLGKRSNLYMGETLRFSVERALTGFLGSSLRLNEKFFPPNSKTDYGELVGMAKALQSMVPPEQFEQFQEIAEARRMIDAEAAKPEPYTLPQFVLVEVSGGAVR